MNGWASKAILILQQEGNQLLCLASLSKAPSSLLLVSINLPSHWHLTPPHSCHTHTPGLTLESSGWFSPYSLDEHFLMTWGAIFIWFSFILWDRVLLCSSGCPWTPYITRNLWSSFHRLLGLQDSGTTWSLDVVFWSWGLGGSSWLTASSLPYSWSLYPGALSQSGLQSWFSPLHCLAICTPDWSCQVARSCVPASSFLTSLP